MNPNLWSRSDRIGVYDHEQAFSFLSLPIIGGAPMPWKIADQAKAFRFLEQHIFYRSLRNGRLDLGPFKQRLAALTEEQLRTYAEPVPSEWLDAGNSPQKIVDYLGEARQEAQNLINFVKHLLR